MPVFFIPRFTVFLCGISLLALGVALSIQSQLGTSPISSLPYVLSATFPLSVGIFTILMHSIMIFLQMLILGSNFQWHRWLQLPAGILFGFIIDALLWLMQSWTPTTYFFQLSCCFLSCLFTATAVCLLIKANLVFLAAEGLYQAFSLRFDWNFGSCKIYGDFILVALAMISSWLFLHNIVGIREGTIISALCVGSLVKCLLPYLSFLDFSHSVK